MDVMDVKTEAERDVVSHELAHGQAGGWSDHAPSESASTRSKPIFSAMTNAQAVMHGARFVLTDTARRVCSTELHQPCTLLSIRPSSARTHLDIQHLAKIKVVHPAEHLALLLPTRAVPLVAPLSARPLLGRWRGGRRGGRRWRR